MFVKMLVMLMLIRVSCRGMRRLVLVGDKRGIMIGITQM